MPKTIRTQRWLIRIFAGVLLTYLALFSFVQMSQWIARWRAERLLSDIRSLRLQQSTWSDAQRVMNRWGRWGGYTGTCDASNCEYHILLTDWLGEAMWRLSRFPRLERLAEPAVYPLLHSVDAHLPEIDSRVDVHNGSVTGLMFSLATEVPFRDYRYDFPMMSRAVFTAHPEFHALWPERNPHPEYSVFMRSGTDGYFVTEFNADTKEKDLESLMQFNFSCLTRFSPCREPSDLRPAAWARYTAENKSRALLEERLNRCDFPLQQLVEAAENVALVRATFMPISDLDDRPLSAELIENLKGKSSWHAGEIRGVLSIPEENNPKTPEQIILFADDGNPIFAHYCGVIAATPRNIEIVRQTLGETATTPSR